MAAATEPGPLMAVAATEAPTAPQAVEDLPTWPLSPEDLMDVASRLEAEAVVIRRLCAGLREDRRRREASARSLRREEPPPPRDGLDGDRVREARLRLRLSQRQLGQELGFSRGIVADAELGRRSCPPLLGAWARRTLGLQKGTA